MKGKIELTRKLQKSGDSISINLPKQLTMMKGWKVGDSITIVLNEKGNLEIKGINRGG